MADVLHTAIRVTDLDAMSGFYEDALGLTDTRQFEMNGTTNYFVSGEGHAEIQFQYDPEDDEPVEPSGIGHLAVGVEDLDATVEECVEEWDSEIETGPLTLEDMGVYVAFVTDPHGYVVELIEDL
jgi:lactoylglutathione lyase